ncbi:cation-transporting P-type ATPase [Nitratifractor sp.]
MAHRRHKKPQQRVKVQNADGSQGSAIAPEPAEEDLKQSGSQIPSVKEGVGGLSSEEAAERLKKFGYNEIKEKEESWIHRLFRRFWGPIPWMIEIAGVLAALAHHWEEFYIILAMLLVNAFVDFYQESKALNAIAVLKKNSPVRPWCCATVSGKRSPLERSSPATWSRSRSATSCLPI